MNRWDRPQTVVWRVCAVVLVGVGACIAFGVATDALIRWSTRVDLGQRLPFTQTPLYAVGYLVVAIVGILGPTALTGFLLLRRPARRRAARLAAIPSSSVDLVAIDREQVLAGDVSAIARSLELAAEVTQERHDLSREIAIAIEGYDQDLRPLWEIPEVVA